MTTPVISLTATPLSGRPPEYQPAPEIAARIDARFARLGADMGLRHLGCSLVEVPPGKQAYPFHGHRHNDELFVMLAGSGELRLGEARHPVREGDLVGCPAGGPETAHALVNTGTQPLRYLAISSQHTPEVCDYPDSGKFGLYDSGADGAARRQPSHFIGRADQALDYWDGE